MGAIALLSCNAASADDAIKSPVEGLPSTSLADQQMDSLISSHKIVYIDGKPHQTQAHIDSIRNLIDNFYYDQFRHFSDPNAPYFLFMSKDAQLAMGIGGTVRMRGWYDWGGAIPANGFSPYLIPMTPDPTNSRKFGTTPAGTCLFFRVIGRNKAIGQYQLYIEANFNGYKSSDFHLKKAYAIVNDWTIGYAQSTFSDPAAETPTIDASGANNKLSKTSVLVRWMHTMKTNWTVAVSAETPASQIDDASGATKALSDWMPDFAAFAQYAWGRSEHIRLSGIMRTLSYRDLAIGKNHNKIGWGLQLSTVCHPLPQVTFYGSVNGGAGYESLSADLSVGNYDLVADPRHPGELYAPYALGWNVGLQYNFLPNLFTSVTYSESHYMPRSGASPDEYKYGRYVAANIFWNLTPRIQTGIEYDWGQRRDVSGQHRHAQRIGLLAQFSF